MEQPQSALLTGGTGLVGTALTRCLKLAGIASTVVTLKGRSQPTAGQGISTYLLPDLSVDSLTSAVQDIAPDLVIHLAAAGVTGSCSIAEMLSVNVDFTVNLIQATARYGRAKMIHTGSCFEYRASDLDRIDEQQPIGPFSLYGASKAASVQLALELSKSLDLPLVVLRLFGIYGPGESERRLIPTLVDGLLQGRRIALTSGTQQRDLLFVQDVAYAILQAVKAFDALEPHTVYNVGSDQATSIREVGEAVAREMGCYPGLLGWGDKPSRAGEPSRIVANSQRFREQTGWSPAHDLPEGIRKTVASWLSAKRAAA